jgi:hypothetical protein
MRTKKWVKVLDNHDSIFNQWKIVFVHLDRNQ